MSPEELTNFWRTRGVALHCYAPEATVPLGLRPATQNFLATQGLPPDSAPFLDFDLVLERVGRLYRLGAGFDQYIRIGSDGAGNPLVLNTADDRVEVLDHEADFLPQYVNQSLPALAVSLVAYTRFVQEVQTTRGEEAFLDANFTDEQFAVLQQQLAEADAHAVAKDSFWGQELNTLIANREAFSQENSK
jgi:SUKH-4 immunity protein